MSLVRPNKNAAVIRFLHLLNIFDKSSRRTNCHDQHAGRERIERARVAHLMRPHQSLHAIDDIARRAAGRLIEIKQTEHWRFQSCTARESLGRFGAEIGQSRLQRGDVADAEPRQASNLVVEQLL